MSAYRESFRQKRQVARVVAEMPASLVSRIDKWGVPAGMKSRTAAIMSLIEKGLDAVAPISEQSAGIGPEKHAPADTTHTASEMAGSSTHG